MKFKIVAAVLALSIVNCPLFIPIASAHLAGQPPFFLIDDKYSNLYPVPLTSLSDFPLPQDLAPATYLVNTDLDMKFDITRLPAPPDVVKKTQFFWDFGDGDKGSGLEMHHTYKKPGSYILSIDAFDGTTPAPQLLESVLINVLPDWNYKLPQAVIRVEGRQSTDPLTDILQFPLEGTLHFDATGSTADPSTKIVSYFWDFGDQQSSQKAQDQHSYSGNTTQIFPVLRIKDANGFIADSFVEVKNGSTVSGGQVVKNPTTNTQGGFNFIPLLLIGVALIIIGTIVKSRKK